MSDAQEALQHLVVLAKHPNGAKSLSWWADELAAEVRAALFVPHDKAVQWQCSDCGIRYNTFHECTVTHYSDKARALAVEVRDQARANLSRNHTQCCEGADYPITGELTEETA
jgi:hypothetical protein